MGMYTKKWIGAMEGVSTPSAKVFLGGTCAGHDWRADLIPQLQIDYFNPIVEDWDEAAYQNELRMREECDFLLYVITPDMVGLYSAAEVADDSNKRPAATTFCWINTDTNFSEAQIKSLERVGELVLKNGGQYFKTLEAVAAHLNGARPCV